MVFGADFRPPPAPAKSASERPAPRKRGHREPGKGGGRGTAAIVFVLLAGASTAVLVAVQRGRTDDPRDIGAVDQQGDLGQVDLPPALSVVLSDIADSTALPTDCRDPEVMFSTADVSFDEFAVMVTDVPNDAARQMLWNIQANLADALVLCKAGDRAAAAPMWQAAIRGTQLIQEAEQ